MALTALALLGERPLHPYEMQRLLHERHKEWAAGKTRELYRAIEDLVGQGLIEAVETTREGRRPERTVYRLTAEGRETLDDRLSRLLERQVEEHPAFFIAVDLITSLPQERAQAALAARTVSLRAELAATEEARCALLEQMHLPRVVLLEVELRLALAAAELRWVSGILDEMRAGKLGWSREFLAAHEAGRGDASDLTPAVGRTTAPDERGRDATARHPEQRGRPSRAATTRHPAQRGRRSRAGPNESPSGGRSR
jgi:DNA-binding PadR family transcriptional regulator